jgi:hypothetical protein
MSATPHVGIARYQGQARRTVGLSTPLGPYAFTAAVPPDYSRLYATSIEALASAAALRNNGANL